MAVPQSISQWLPPDARCGTAAQLIWWHSPRHGNILATSGIQDGQVCLWAIPSGQPLGSFPVRTRPVRRWEEQAAALSTDGRRVASLRRCPQVVVWDVASRTELVRFHHEHTVLTIAFSPDGCHIAAGDEQQTVLWSCDSGCQISAHPAALACLSTWRTTTGCCRSPRNHRQCASVRFAVEPQRAGSGHARTRAIYELFARRNHAGLLVRRFAGRWNLHVPRFVGAGCRLRRRDAWRTVYSSGVLERQPLARRIGGRRSPRFWDARTVEPLGKLAAQPRGSFTSRFPWTIAGWPPQHPMEVCSFGTDNCWNLATRSCLKTSWSAPSRSLLTARPWPHVLSTAESCWLTQTRAKSMAATEARRAHSRPGLLSRRHAAGDDRWDIDSLLE